MDVCRAHGANGEGADPFEVEEEQDPPDRYQPERHRPLQECGKNVPIDFAVMIRGNQDTVIQSPNDEGPSRSVPQSAQCHDKDDIADITLVSAQRNVDVVANPKRQRDVPAAPELSNVQRFVGPFEVLGKGKPEQSAEPMATIE